LEFGDYMEIERDNFFVCVIFAIQVLVFKKITDFPSKLKEYKSLTDHARKKQIFKTFVTI